ncbi:hypothetical protein MNBD_CHLOROFLEXI01-997 [hydrothermal vent metagenome]|uniref:Uncharacterized protein n=1 Tax=hydrothermal vent metagenome TaxID=652676 RepID=A0A3B0VQZ0_9ZZZZ
MNAEDADNKSKSAFICVNPRPISFKTGLLKNPGVNDSQIDKEVWLLYLPPP